MSTQADAQRKQMLMVGTIMAGFFFHSFISSGGFQGVQFETGIFPGGEIVYKFATRDYAAAPSLLDWIASDAMLPAMDMEDRMYTFYFDDPRGLSGDQQRFAAGYLSTDKETRQVYRNLLNKEATKVDQSDVTAREMKELPVLELWSRLKYESASLPSVNCAVVQFPFTNGFISALIFQYKIIPAIRLYAEDNLKDSSPGAGPIIVSTCSVAQSMCTHYLPLVKTRRFHLGGRARSASYASTLPIQSSFDLFDWDGIKKRIRKFVSGAE